MIVDTNNGTEAQNKAFKYEYLPLSLNKSVYGISVMLVDRYIPDCHQNYIVSLQMFQRTKLYLSFSKSQPRLYS